MPYLVCEAMEAMSMEAHKRMDAQRQAEVCGERIVYGHLHLMHSWRHGSREL